MAIAEAAHISVRLYWHDGGWDGAICKKPSANVWCEGHERVRDLKNPTEEDEVAGRTLLETDVHPPCEASIQAFACQENVIRFNPPEWMANARVRPVDLKLKPYTTTMWPFENMWEEDSSHKPNEERCAIAEDFKRRVVPNESLVFFYVDEENPLLTNYEGRSTARVLVGISRVTKIGEIEEWKEPDWWGNINMVWAIPICHAYPKDGIILPVHELLQAVSEPDERALYLVSLDGGLRTDFRYWSSEVSLDRAVTVLERAIAALQRIQSEKPIAGDYRHQIQWLNARLLELWKQRGPYPGVGAVLSALSARRGAEIQLNAVPALQESGVDAVQALVSALEGKPLHLVLKPYAEDLALAAEEWQYLDKNVQALIPILCRMGLQSYHVEHIINEDQRMRHRLPKDPKAIFENPYILSEQLVPNADEEAIDFAVVDHALLPHEVMGSIPGVQYTRRDTRRFRALAVQVLRKASTEGHTFLDIQTVSKGVIQLTQQSDVCDLPIERMSHPLVVKALAGVIDVFTECEQVFYALRDIRDDELTIRDTLLELTGRERISVPPRQDWQSLVPGCKGDSHDSVILSEEQREALNRSYGNSVSVITGAAGTGKSSLLAPLIAGIRADDGRVRVLALAPTGKAADRLRQLDVEAMTIHRALANADRYDWDLKRLKRQGTRKISANTIVIDEASMVDNELLATLFRAVKWSGVARLVLVGDYHQLPPIGPGRPFYDFAAELRINEDRRTERQEILPDAMFLDRLSELKENHRVASGSRAAALANSYARSPEAEEPEILAGLADGKDEGDLKVRFWSNANQLHELTRQEISNLLASHLDSVSNEQAAFNASIGHDDSFGASFWQLLSPVRDESYGTRKLNAIIQDKYHGGFKVTTPKRFGVKFGDERITCMDKVIQIANEKRRVVGTQSEEQLYNGQLGIVKGEYPPANKSRNDRKGRPNYINIEFDGKKDLQFSYASTGLKHGVNGRLELAYAITVHKSQGSQFAHVFLVIPKAKTRHLSRELLYTGLTRGQASLTLFIKDDIERLLDLRRPKEAVAPRRNSRLFQVRAGALGFARSDGHIHVTLGGDHVISKSEVIVANLLHQYKKSHGLDYEYEKELMPTGDPRDMRLPDFQITYRGRTFFWEHCGMVDDPIYLHKWNNVRLPWYAKHGLDASLIVSYDKPGGGIDSQEIEKLIKARILGEA